MNARNSIKLVSFFFMFNDRRERGTTLGAIYDSAVAEPGEGPGPPLFLDQNEARRATIISGSRLPPPPPPTLSLLPEGLDPPLLRFLNPC